MPPIRDDRFSSALPSRAHGKTVQARPLVSYELWNRDPTDVSVVEARDVHAKALAKQDELLHARFDQNQYLDELVSTTPLEVRKTIPTAGICFGAAVTWLTLRQHAPHASPQQILDALADPDNRVAIETQIETRGGCAPTTEWELHPQKDTSFTLDDRYTKWDDQRLELIAETILADAGMGHLLLHWADEPLAGYPSSGHAVAFYNPGRGRDIEFFDADRGAFSIPPTHLEELLLAHREYSRMKYYFDQSLVRWPRAPPMMLREARGPNGEATLLPRVQTDMSALSLDMRVRFDAHTAPDEVSRNAAATVKDFVTLADRLTETHVKPAPYFDESTRPPTDSNEVRRGRQNRERFSQVFGFNRSHKSPASLLHEEWDAAVETLGGCARSLKTSHEAVEALKNDLSSEGSSSQAVVKREVLDRLVGRLGQTEPGKLKEVSFVLLQKLRKSESKAEEKLKRKLPFRAPTAKDRAALERVRAKCRQMIKRTEEAQCSWA